MPSSSRASGGCAPRPTSAARSQRTGPRPPRSDGRSGDVLARAQAAQIERGVVPAHPVQQLRQFRRGARRDEELRAPVGRQPRPGPAAAPSAPGAPGRGRPAPRRRSITSKARPAGSSTAAPGYSAQASVGLVERGPGRHLVRRSRSGCAPGSGQPAPPHEQTPPPRRRAPGHHRPAPQPGVLGDGGALGRAAAAPGART